MDKERPCCLLLVEGMIERASSSRRQQGQVAAAIQCRIRLVARLPG